MNIYLAAALIMSLSEIELLINGLSGSIRFFAAELGLSAFERSKILQANCLEDCLKTPS